MANGGLHDAGEKLMGIMLALVCVLLFVGCGVGAWRLRERAKVEGTTPLTWFDVAAVPSHFFSSPDPIAFSPELLLDSLGAQGEQRRVHVSERPIPGLLGTELLSTVGVPTELAGSMRIAAAACGVLVAPSSVAGGPGSGLIVPTSDFTVTGPSPWLLGMDISGESVSVQAVPGSTILVLGNAAALPQHHWFRLINVDSENTVADAWEAAWDPGVCRVVKAPGISDAGDPQLEGIYYDIVVSVQVINGDVVGEVVHQNTGYRQTFWPLFTGIKQVPVPIRRRL